MSSPGALLISKYKSESWAHDEQLALCADESEHARTQGGGIGRVWHHAPRTDSEVIVILRQRVSKRTMVWRILVKNRDSHCLRPASDPFIED